jgi:UDP-N-acetyl-D-glucosamine dehydrogenase
MPFYPGPGLGGHCIPIDPFYLTWKAREYDLEARFIELAGQINSAMPVHVLNRLAESIDRHQGKGLNGSDILIVGLSYKPNIGDVRESPALRIMQMLLDRGARTSYHDPFVPQIPATREFSSLTGILSSQLSPDVIKSKTAILLATEHDAIDYELLAENSRLIIDTRNAFARRGFTGDKYVKA